MLKNLSVILLTIIIFSCTENIFKEEKIDDVEINLKIDEGYQDKLNIYHIYFYNRNNKKERFGINLFNDNNISLSIFPGIYDIYIYGLNEKNEDSLKVFSYYIINGIECFGSIS